ncbi:MAG: triose-phosphate isomerase [Candidatus Omnitrophica bacterium]|nr:triose-phosphate isomerase [Candidatus Omnitrophota bacterium]MBU1926060.1 triose-phosphate isomerase [Candidatus Omnitrophota bacterium]MBU2063116.1 triose-phosphate isomerase [Candidatus Omnitrophota bacterium]
MRRKIIAGNWKMNNTVTDSLELVRKLSVELKDVKDADIVVCPPFTALYSVGQEIEGSNIKLGAQNLFWEEKGAFTGEISAAMLKDVHCEYVIIGHSERRNIFKETNSNVNKKVKAVIGRGLLPIVCVGEKEEERKANKTFDIICAHIQRALAGLSADDLKGLIVAYEPVWAIGTGVNATAQQAQEVHAFIRDLVAKNFGKEPAAGLRIQYGGSVTPQNISSLIKEPDIDGALVGGASLKADSFLQIVKLSLQPGS